MNVLLYNHPEWRAIVNQIRAAVTVIVRALSSWWYGWVNMLLLNAAWIICTVTIVLAGPGTLALCFATYEAARGRSGGFSDFIEGFRTYFLRSYVWFILNVVAVALVWINLQFYTQYSEVWAAFASLMTLILAAVWFTVQLYALPFLMEQDEKRLRVALRNGLFTLLASPLYSLILVTFVVALLALVFWQPVVLLVGVPAVIALTGNHAVQERITTFGIRERGAKPDDVPANP